MNIQWTEEDNQRVRNVVTEMLADPTLMSQLPISRKKPRWLYLPNYAKWLGIGILCTYFLTQLTHR
jgi:hypothetical protein